MIKDRKVKNNKFWPNLDVLYKVRLNSFLELAGQHIYNRDHAIDAVHDAFTKSLKYFNKNPNKKVSEFVVRSLILRSCKKMNKYSKEVPYGTFNDTYSELDNG